MQRGKARPWELSEGPAVPALPIMQSMPSVNVARGLQLPSNIRKVWPSSDRHQFPYHPSQGKHTGTRAWLPTPGGHGSSASQAVSPASPSGPSSLPEMDIHALLQKRSRKQLASKCRVAQPGHRGENTKTNLKKSPRP